MHIDSFNIKAVKCQLFSGLFVISLLIITTQWLQNQFPKVFGWPKSPFSPSNLLLSLFNKTTFCPRFTLGSFTQPKWLGLNSDTRVSETSWSTEGDREVRDRLWHLHGVVVAGAGVLQHTSEGTRWQCWQRWNLPPMQTSAKDALKRLLQAQQAEEKKVIVLLYVGKKVL